MDLATYAVLNKKIDAIGNIPDEKITEAVNTYLDENPPTTGATAEQAAQINKNVADIDELKGDIVKFKYKLFDLKSELTIPKLISSKSGWASDSTAYLSTDFIEVRTGDEIVYNLVGGDENIANLSFYTNKDWKTFDENNLIVGGGRKTGVFIVPSNGFVRVCCSVQSFNKCTLYFKGRTIEYNYPINVKLYGAMGDGVTDDTKAIQNAINDNYSVYFPNGTYIVSDTIIIPPNHSVIGESKSCTNLKYNGDNTDVLKAVLSSEDGANDVTIRDITIDGANKCMGIYLQATSEEVLKIFDTHGLVEECQILNCTYGLRIGRQCRGAYIKHIYIRNCSRHGIYVQGTDNFIIDCIGINIDWSGILLQSSNNVVRNGRMGICNRANNGNSAYKITDSINNSIVGVTAQQNHQNAFIIQNSSRCIVLNFQSDWNNVGNIDGNDTAHFKILNSSLCKVEGIIIDGEMENNHSVYGLFLEGSSEGNVIDVLIAHNEAFEFAECNAIKGGTLATNNKLTINGEKWI